MTKAEIFHILKQQIILVLPLVNEAHISADKKLVDMGANSIDRAEIVISVMQALDLKIPANQLTEITNIQDLIDTFYLHINT